MYPARPRFACRTDVDLKLLLLYFSDSGRTGPVGEDVIHQVPRGRLRVLGVGKQNLPKSLSLSQ